jgi:hypothetical protein
MQEAMILLLHKIRACFTWRQWNCIYWWKVCNSKNIPQGKQCSLFHVSVDLGIICLHHSNFFQEQIHQRRNVFLTNDNPEPGVRDLVIPIGCPGHTAAHGADSIRITTMVNAPEDSA